MKNSNHTKSSSKKTLVVSKKTSSKHSHAQSRPSVKPSDGLPTPCVSQLNQLAIKRPGNDYQRFMESTGMSSGNTSEVHTRFTFFDDWKTSSAQANGGVLLKSIRRSNALFTYGSPPQASDRTLARMKSCRVYALNRFQSGSVADTSVLATSFVRNEVPGAAIQYSASRTTIIKPDAKVEWHMIADWQYGKLFKDSQTLPCQWTAANEIQMFELGGIILHDPDQGVLLQSDVQLMYVVEMAFPLAPLTEYQQYEQYQGGNTATPTETTAAIEDVCMTQFSGISNSI